MESGLPKLKDDVNKKVREKELLFYESVFETDERETIESMNNKNMLPYKLESEKDAQEGGDTIII